MMMMCAARLMATFITTVSAKTWKNGRTPNTRSVPLPRSELHAAT